MIITSRTLRVACVAVAVTSLAACGGHSKKKAPTTPPTTVAPTTSAPLTTAPPPVAAINPFTGGKPSDHRVVAVKIDDTANGRPQVNVDKADIVYIEEVEGGLTRLLAVFHTALPTVEAVRSTRASDPQLMAQYGPVVYVASGGAPNPMQVLEQSNLHAVTNDRGGPGFARDFNRPAPYNLTANLAQASAGVHGAVPKDIGFTWSAATAKLASKPRAASIQTVVGGTPVRFDWDSGLKKYVRVIDGARQRTADGTLISTPNVIVQFCAVSPYPQDVDVVGNISQFTHTVGIGKVVVYRNGRRIDGVWTRSKAKYGTRLLDKFNHRIALAPGGAWVVLVTKGAPLS